MHQFFTKYACLHDGMQFFAQHMIFVYRIEMEHMNQLNGYHIMQ